MIFQIKIYNQCYSYGIVKTSQNKFKILSPYADHEIIIEKLFNTQRFTLDLETDIKQLCNKIEKINLEIERDQVVKAMNLTKGHWFKCPNGHFYAIGECGGAMEEAKCIECKSSIGGSDHRLRSDNRFASEVDGATAPAWPGVHM